MLLTRSQLRNERMKLPAESMKVLGVDVWDAAHGSAMYPLAMGYDGSGRVCARFAWCFACSFK